MNEKYYELLGELDRRMEKLECGFALLREDLDDEIQNERETLDFLANGPGGTDPD